MEISVRITNPNGEMTGSGMAVHIPSPTTQSIDAAKVPDSNHPGMVGTAVHYETNSVETCALSVAGAYTSVLIHCPGTYPYLFIPQDLTTDGEVDLRFVVPIQGWTATQ